MTESSRGPGLRLLEATPASGEGVDCGPIDVDCGVPVNAPIRLRLDRPLRPSTAVRQSIRVFTGSPNNAAPALTPVYDVLSRELVFHYQGNLEPRALYRIELLQGKTQDEAGLLAFDGAPLVEGPVPLSWSFMTAGPSVRAVEPEALSTPDCAEVAALLSASCGASCCHGAEPAMGLRLLDPESVAATAVGRVAHQTDTGNTIGSPLLNPRRFGVGMPIIEPLHPYNSYLIYKLLLEPKNLEPCTTGCGPFADLPDADRCVPLGADEARRLREWFVQGDPMPPPRGTRADESCDRASARDHPLDCGSLRALARFISDGASCD